MSLVEINKNSEPLLGKKNRLSNILHILELFLEHCKISKVKNRKLLVWDSSILLVFITHFFPISFPSVTLPLFLLSSVFLSWLFTFCGSPATFYWVSVPLFCWISMYLNFFVSVVLYKSHYRFLPGLNFYLSQFYLFSIFITPF